MLTLLAAVLGLLAGAWLRETYDKARAEKAYDRGFAMGKLHYERDLKRKLRERWEANGGR